MSEISVGDLVVVVRSYSCGCAYSIGKIFQVCEIRNMSPGPWACDAGHRGMHNGYVAAAYGPGFRDTEALNVLRRIPPLWELDETEHKEETPA